MKNNRLQVGNSQIVKMEFRPHISKRQFSSNCSSEFYMLAECKRCISLKGQSSSTHRSFIECEEDTHKNKNRKAPNLNIKMSEIRFFL